MIKGGSVKRQNKIVYIQLNVSNNIQSIKKLKKINLNSTIGNILQISAHNTIKLTPAYKCRYWIQYKKKK